MVIAGQVRAETVWGKSAALGQGTARAFVEMNALNQPVALGIMLRAKALQGLPTKPAEPPETLLALPDKIVVPPLKYIAVNWNPQGHEPKMYAVPHFDFHFYIIPNADRERITAGNTVKFAKVPPARYLPADYLQAPGGVPKMGAHWGRQDHPRNEGKAVYRHLHLWHV